MAIDTTSSHISIHHIQGKSVLTESKVLRPLRIFSLPNDTALQIIFSNYGGGFVEGDQIKMALHCGAQSTSVFTSQANTRVYRSEKGITSSQEITAQLGKGAFAAFLCDPLVPHADSLFEQKHNWQLDDESVLLFTDWFEAGRILNGERFAFAAYTSEFKVTQHEVPLVWDRFHIHPTDTDPNSPGAFLNHSSYMNIFLVGNDTLPRFQILEKTMKQLAQQYFSTENTLVANEATLIGSFVKINEKVAMIRCTALRNEMLLPLMRELSESLSHKDLLGFDPGRKV